jgi:ADP-ribosylation factor GTPase-activating protein 1
LDYKDKLTAEIEGKVWTPVARPARPPRSSTPLQPASTPLSRASSTSSFQQPQTASQKARNETYFAGLGSANSQRPDGVPPSQGGRYTGFGSAPPPTQPSSQNESLSVEDFTSDPLGTLTKGWSMFSKVAVKTASMVHESYVQPSVAKVLFPRWEYYAYESYKILISMSLSRGISQQQRILFKKLDWQGIKR